MHMLGKGVIVLAYAIGLDFYERLRGFSNPTWLKLESGVSRWCGLSYSHSCMLPPVFSSYGSPVCKRCHLYPFTFSHINLLWKYPYRQKCEFHHPRHFTIQSVIILSNSGSKHTSVDLLACLSGALRRLTPSEVEVKPQILYVVSGTFYFFLYSNPCFNSTVRALLPELLKTLSSL